MPIFLEELRYAVRRLRQSPGFTLTAVLTLALGIGPTTAIFTLVYQVMLRPLPVEKPEQLYRLGKEIHCCVNGGLRGDWSLFPYDLYRYLRDQTSGVPSMAAVQAGQTVVSARRAGSPAPAQPLGVRFVSGNYFPMLGVQAYAGRLLQPKDDQEAASPAAVLSYTLWRTKFNADPRLVGSTLLLTGHPYTVVGIAEPSFLGERNEADPAGLWLALAQEPVLEPENKLLHLPGAEWLDVLARLPDRKHLPAVQQALNGALRQWLGSHADAFDQQTTTQAVARQTTTLTPAPDGINALGSDAGGTLELLQFIAAFVLLIACVNLANLLLVRGMARKQEFAIRGALGASRLRLLQQALLEALLLALAGGAAALMVAYSGSRAILALAFKSAGFVPIDPAPSWPVLAFAGGAALLASLLFGIAPAWLVFRSHPADALRGANRSTRDATGRPQKALVVIQCALSVALLATAGLLAISLRHLEDQNFHFQPEGRLFLQLELQGSGFGYEQLSDLYRRIDNRLKRLPVAESFAYATYMPLTGYDWHTGVWLPGAQDPQTATYAAVSADYFQALGIRVLAGRSIGEQDTAASAPVAVVNRTFADRYLKGKQPVGEHFGPDPHHAAHFTIVGVVEDARYGDGAKPESPMLVTPITQALSYTDAQSIEVERVLHFANHLVVHYRGDPSAASAQVRQALAEVDPKLVILKLSTYTEQVSERFVQEDLAMRLTTLFGLLALGLAALGLYGVTAYGVARRTPEIGLRMALGASRGGVVGMVLGGALRQAGAGLALGLPLAYGAARLLAHTLYQTSPFQPLILLGAAGCLLLASFVAALLPARRAASVDPVIALRSE